MGFPKKVIPTINLTPEKILFERREQLLQYITEDGTYLPKQLLHPEMDRGFLDFVKEDLKTTVAGKVIPMVDIIESGDNFCKTFVELQKMSNDLKYPNGNIAEGIVVRPKTMYYSMEIGGWCSFKVKNQEFKIAKTPMPEYDHENRLGIAGVWFVFRGRDSFNK